MRQLENIVSFAVVSAKGPVVTLADLPRHFLDAVALGRQGVGGDEGEPVQPMGAAPGASAGRGVPRLESRSAASQPSGGVSAPPVAPPAPSLETFPSLAQAEAQHIRAALVLADGNKSRAARLLGISRTTLYRKVEELTLAE